MGAAKRAPGGGGNGRRDGQPGAAAERAPGQEAGRVLEFEDALRLLYADAKSQNNTKMMGWFKGLLKSLAKDEPDAYALKLKREFEEHSKRSFDENVERSLDRRMAKGYEERLDRRMAKGYEERLDRRMAKGYEERLDRRMAKGYEERLDRRMRRNIERQTEKQIMVDNFRVFRREYMDMMIRRSC